MQSIFLSVVIWPGSHLRVGDLVDHRQVSLRRTVAVFALNAIPYSKVFPFRPLQ